MPDPMTVFSKAPSLAMAWRQLPTVVKNCVLHHSALPEPRLQAGLALLNPPDGAALVRNQLALAADLLLAAWECSPTETALVPQLLALHQQFPFLQPAQHRLFAVLAQKGLSGIADTASLSPTNPRWPLQSWQQGVACFDRGDYQQALQHFTAARHCWTGIAEVQGHCLLRMGRREEAFQFWRQVLARRPWHVQLALTLHDCLRGYDTASPVSTDACSVLLYSWNKAEYLHNTLHALEASLPDIAQVICLNNGSTDTTADCLKAWAERWSSRLKSIHLPVNVGAAAARNWLAALPEVQALPFAAYVDDDVSLPPDWLRHLIRAVQVQPQASAWGCRILDAPPLAAAQQDSGQPATAQTTAQYSPPLLQSGPLHLTLDFAPPVGVPPLPGQSYGPEAENADLAFSPLRAHGEPFSVSTMPPHCIDRGQWNYIRSCASVTGCCHLFRTQDLRQNAFALSLSPSQYDDLEYDLRALRGQPDQRDQSGGRMACYTGFCAALHAQKSGQAAGGLSAAAYGSALGNKYKLHGMFSAEEITRMARTESTLLEQDIVQKLAFIDENSTQSATLPLV